MRKILSTKSQRYLNLLEYLIDDTNWVTIQFLSEKLNYSYQILRDDIIFINETFAPFKIETSQRHGIRLNMPESYTIDFLYEKILENSIEYELLELIFLDNTLNYERLSTLLFISTSTLTRIVTRIKKSNDCISLLVNTTQSLILGEELAIRYFFTNYFLDRYPYQTFHFPDGQLAIVQRLISCFDFDLNHGQYQKLTLFLLTSLKRMSQGYRLTQIPRTKPLIDKLSHQLLMNSSLIHEFNHTFKLKLDKTVLLELFFPFFHLNSLSVSDVTFSSHNDDDLLVGLTQFIKELESSFNIESINVDELVCNLYNLTFSFSEHNYLLYNRKKRFIDIMSVQYPYYTRQLKRLIDASPLYSSSAISNDFKVEALYILMTHWQDLIPTLSSAMIKVKIGVFGEFDKQHSIFLSDLISYHFSEHVLVTTLNARSIIQAKKISQQLDLVITTLPNINWLSAKSQTINLVPTSEDIDKLQDVIIHLTTKKNLINNRTKKEKGSFTMSNAR